MKPTPTPTPTRMTALRDGVFLLAGIVVTGLGLKSFLLPNRFIDGGVIGISLLVAEVSAIPLWVLLVAINVPFILLGARAVGVSFAVRSGCSIALLAVCLALVPYPVVTHDKLLASVFGGFFIGVGTGLVIRAHSVVDGTDVVALLVSKRLSVTVGDVMLVVNIFIFSVAAALLGVESALYSILTYLGASKTVDLVQQGVEAQQGVTIISSQHETIRQAILHDVGRAVTVYKGEGGLSGEPIDIMFCVVTRLELAGLKKVVREHDPAAFVIAHPISDTSGGMVRRSAALH